MEINKDSKTDANNEVPIETIVNETMPNETIASETIPLETLPTIEINKKGKNPFLKIGIAAVIILLALYGAVTVISWGMLMNDHDKISESITNMFTPDKLLTDLDCSELLVSEKYQSTINMSLASDEFTGSLSLLSKTNLEEKKMSSDMTLVGLGESDIGAHMYFDSEKLAISAPMLNAKTIAYYYNKENTGYLLSQVDSQYIDMLNKSLASAFDGKETQVEYSLESKKIIQDFYEASEIQKLDTSNYEVDGKVRKCNGYRLIFTGDKINKLCDDLAAVYDTYFSEMYTALDKDTTAVDGTMNYSTNPFTQLKDALKLEATEEVDVDIYLYQLTVAAVIVEENETQIEILCKGGDTPLQNFKITVVEDGKESVINRIGSNAGTVEKYEYEIESEEINNVSIKTSYDTKTGDLVIEVPDMEDITVHIQKDEGKLEVSMDQTMIDEYTISGSMKLEAGGEIEALTGEEFDIGNATEEEYMTFLYEIMGGMDQDLLGKIFNLN